MISLQEDWLQEAIHQLKDDFSWQHAERQMWGNGKQRDSHVQMVASLETFMAAYNESISANGDREAGRNMLKQALNIINGDSTLLPVSWRFFGFGKKSNNKADGAINLIPQVILEMRRMVEYMSPREAQRKTVGMNKSGVIGTHHEVKSLKVGAPKSLDCIAEFYATVCREGCNQTGSPLAPWNWDGNHPLHGFMEEVLVLVGNHLRHGDAADQMLLSELCINAAEASLIGYKKIKGQ